MKKIMISEDKRSFKLNNRKIFYLADTVWSAFTNISMYEWEYYLDYRKAQGFNALQINILHQWDASETNIETIKPFKVNHDGTYDFNKINEEYFMKASKMLQMAVDKGFIPVLVLLWSNYVPGTWASDLDDSNIMPIDAIENYVKYVGQEFKRFNPVYCISGDTDFETELTREYYKITFETIKKISPESLMTFHIRGRLVEIPEVFMEDSRYDFYMYQSGHNTDYRYMAYKMAEIFYGYPIKRPIINSEPCYEFMGFSRKKYGRFTRFDVRKAAWQSLLSGASAGITYGAHGIWSWYRKGMKFRMGNGEGFIPPYDWQEALKGEGAWDYSFAKWIFETYQLMGIVPAKRVLNDTEEIRMAVTKDKSRVAIYIPVNISVIVDMDLTKYELVMIDLKNRYFGKPELKISNGKSIFAMNNFEEDTLIIGVKKDHI